MVCFEFFYQILGLNPADNDTPRYLQPLQDLARPSYDWSFPSPTFPHFPLIRLFSWGMGDGGIVKAKEGPYMNRIRDALPDERFTLQHLSFVYSTQL